MKQFPAGGQADHDNSLASQAWAKSQSRRTVRGEIFRAATISSSVKPPKYRNSTTLAWRGASCEKAVRAASKARMDRSGAAVRSLRYEEVPSHLTEKAVAANEAA